MAQTTFGYANEHLCLRSAFSRHDTENGTQREDGDGTATCREERLDVFLQTEVLTLRETIHFHILKVLGMGIIVEVGLKTASRNGKCFCQDAERCLRGGNFQQVLFQKKQKRSASCSPWALMNNLLTSFLLRPHKGRLNRRPKSMPLQITGCLIYCVLPNRVRANR